MELNAAMGLDTQVSTLLAVLMAAAILLLCCIAVVLMVRSRRPDAKMTFLTGLLNAVARSERRPKVRVSHPPNLH